MHLKTILNRVQNFKYLLPRDNGIAIAPEEVTKAIDRARLAHSGNH